MHRRLEEFLAIVKRELDAEEAAFVAVGVTPPDGAGWLSAGLRDGTSVAARLPIERALGPAKERLDALVEAFHLALTSVHVSSRPPRSELLEALHAELISFASEAGARDAFILDAHSPILWGTTETEAPTPRERLLRSAACFRAAAKLRALPAMALLPRGGHLSGQETAAGFGYMARSFASIYVAAVVYDGAFEELRARRAFAHALAPIERLLVALPPLDPSPVPIARAAAARARRRT